MWPRISSSGILCLIATLICLPVQSKLSVLPHSWEFKINAGYNIGGTSPLPLPAEIRKIERYAPVGLALHGALEATYWFDEKWGVSAQIASDLKGFSVRDRVMSLWTEMETDNGQYTTGTFTGCNETNIRNTYLTLPAMATYHLADNWYLQAGIYAAWLYNSVFKGNASDGYLREGAPTGEKILVDFARFDFSEKQRLFDWGAIAAAEWNFSGWFFLRGQLAWGFVSVFPSDFTGMPFKMYNVYGTIAVSYRLGRL
ncbi:MAG: PorT family protein [Dysgonamonadaceae bacterium]|jgi:hypothetical protein|nr:PorT family protein [Dysgonamonadaceae bacterium]